MRKTSRSVVASGSMTVSKPAATPCGVFATHPQAAVIDFLGEADGARLAELLQSIGCDPVRDVVTASLPPPAGGRRRPVGCTRSTVPVRFEMHCATSTYRC
jgi:hypothetical protein